MADILQEAYPWTRAPLICNAPMGGYAGAKLAVEVSKAGGLGFIGAGSDMSSVDSELAKARKLAADAPNLPKDVLPVGIGFLCFAMNKDEVASLVQKHNPAVVWLFSVHKLDDFTEWVNKIRRVSGARIWIQTGCVHDALEIGKTCNPDALVMQGMDAGGHGADKGAGIISLLPETADALATEGRGVHKNIPLLAAGGIADHRGVAASLMIGAAGVVLGTTFLASSEVKLPHPYVGQAILDAKDGGQSTVRSHVFDDMNTSITWPSYFDGRALRNDTSKDWEAGTSTEDNRARFVTAQKGADRGYGGERNRSSVWCGTGVGLVRNVKPANQIVQDLRAGAQKLMRGTNARL